MRISPFQHPVRDQRERERDVLDLTWGALDCWRSDTGFIGWAGTGIPLPTLEVEDNVRRRRLWKVTLKTMGEEASGAG